jgi:pyruvate dehydrogenase E2 component (dihydrolipoamide acetyltransferase)
MENIQGSGPKGRIIEQDVRASVESSPKITPLAKKMAEAEQLPSVANGTGLGGSVTAKDLTAVTRCTARISKSKSSAICGS